MLIYCQKWEMEQRERSAVFRRGVEMDKNRPFQGHGFSYRWKI
jgi:hypothetical protein